MNNYLMFDRLLKCSVVPKVGTKRSLCGEKDNILFHYCAGENEQGDIQREGERAETAWENGHVRPNAINRI